jgi:hypothetical protein
MTTFRSESEAKKAAEKIANTVMVFFTNDGLEITFTSDVKNQKDIVNQLKSVFSDVKLKGRISPSIAINRISRTTVFRRITEVVY